MTELSHCPKCNASFDGEDIYQFFFNKYSKDGIPDYARDIEDIKKSIKLYPTIYKNAPSFDELEKMSELELAAWDTANNYGWSKKNPKCFRKELGIEIQGLYDGVVLFQCVDCKHKWKRVGFEWIDDKYLN